MTKKFPADMSSIEAIQNAYKEIMLSQKINEKLVQEYLLVVEEVVIKLIEKADRNAEISLKVYTRFNRSVVQLGCPGKYMTLFSGDRDDFGGMILREYRDYMNQSYSSGTNYITFENRTGSRFIWFVIPMIAALPVYFAMTKLIPADMLAYLDDNVIYPLACIFVSFMNMLAGPIVFFSIAAFIIRLRHKFRQDEKITEMTANFVFYSVIAILTGFFAAHFLNQISHIPENIYGRAKSVDVIGGSLEDVITNVVPPNIVEIFTSMNPIPLVLTSLILGLAASNVFGPEGITVRHVIYSIDKLFGKILGLVYSWMPVFLFLSMLSCLIAYGYAFYLFILKFIALILPVFLMYFMIYMIQLIVNDINPLHFFKEYGTVVLDNLLIGSNIDALPYNKRELCRRNRGHANQIKEYLALGTVVNLDGNCLILSTFTFIMIKSCNIQPGLATIVGVVFIIFMVSMGAPNHPGSFIMGGAIIVSYLGISTEILTTVIILEAVFGKLYSFINSMGDIVNVVVEMKRQQIASEKSD